MSYFTQVSYSDTGSLDAFSRLRTSSVENIFATQCQYTTDPIQMETGATGTGVAPSYSANTRMVSLSATTGSGTSFTQSYQYSPYQPGHSHFIAETFVMGSGVAGATVDVGYFDAANGIIFRQNGTTNLQFILRTSTGGSVSDANIVAQSAWNIDKMDGTGASGLTLDVTKAQILVIDLQFLGMGRVRIGFDINGVIYYAHQFLNANNLTVPYIQSATLPVQMLVSATSTGSTKTSFFKCAAVQSEGGQMMSYGYMGVTPDTAATAATTRVPLVSIRPKTTFNGITNRSMFVMDGVSLANLGNNDVYWELAVGVTWTTPPTYADVNTTYSSYEYGPNGTYLNLNSGIVIASGYATRTANGSPIQNLNFNATQAKRYPITLDRAGAARAMGTLTLFVTSLSSTAACRGSIQFKEIR